MGLQLGVTKQHMKGFIGEYSGDLQNEHTFLPIKLSALLIQLGD